MKLNKSLVYISVFLFGFIIGALFLLSGSNRSLLKKVFRLKKEDIVKNDKVIWRDIFQLVEIPSKIDGYCQNAYFFRSTKNNPRPLIVSLHSWNGDYTQRDTFADISARHNINYIHPDFRGANVRKEACCSNLAISDIDDAISYAIENSNIDTSKIFMIGGSGGGHAALCAFMKSNYQIKKFSVWVPITDLIAWHRESAVIGNNHDKEILECTNSKNGNLNIENAKLRSPIFMKTPIEKLADNKLSIYAGVNDGVIGSVPITHSINMYNKVLSDLMISDSTKYVSIKEKLFLLEHRMPYSSFGFIGDRKICLFKESGNVSLTIFDGEHETLPTYAFEELLNQ